MRAWDYDDAVLLHTYPVGQSIAYLAALPARRDSLYCVLFAPHVATPSPAAAAATPSSGSSQKKSKKSKKRSRSQVEADDGAAAGPQVPLPGVSKHYRVGEETAAALARHKVKPRFRFIVYSLARSCVERVLLKNAGYCTGLATRPALTAAHALQGTAAAANGMAASQAAAAEGAFVAVTFKRRVAIWDVRARRLAVYEHTKPLTTVALHPRMNVVATGDAEGQITLWHNLLGAAPPADATQRLSSSKAIATTTHHWHAHAATSIAFSPDGSIMLSGGREAVLVLWQIASGARQYLPRMGAPLRALACSPDARVYSVGMSDNSVCVVDAASMTEQWRMRGVAICKCIVVAAASAHTLCAVLYG